MFGFPWEVLTRAATRKRPFAPCAWLTTAANRLRAVASSVVDLNRAIVHSMAFGPEAGLRLVDEIADAATLRNYAPCCL